ncbi:uncharacterized protein [Penaeus vannamei]|uniref:uncharacterized protein n=1 Tax=Penaeus vannamei TaxID=6689 RepID=UPI00387F42F3
MCRTWSLLRKDKEQFIRSLAEEIEGHIFVNHLCHACQALIKLNSKPSLLVTAIHSISGQIISDPVAVWERWAEYFEQLYQVDPPIGNLHVGSAKIPLLDPPISEDPPSLTEVRRANSKLKRGKAVPICSKGCMLSLPAIWQSSTIPLDQLRIVAISLWKGIAALHAAQYTRQGSHPYSSKTSQGPPVEAPEAGRRREFGHGLLAAYIDLKKVFDAMHQVSLWEILRLKEIPTSIIGLMASLYTGTECAINDEAKPFGLEVSWTKTKIQDFGDLLGEPIQSVHACGEDIDVTESFTYLGHGSRVVRASDFRWFEGSSPTTSAFFP